MARANVPSSKRPDERRNHAPRQESGQSTFAVYAQELRDLEKREPRPTDKEANAQINRVCADAVRDYEGYAARGIQGFNAALVRDPRHDAGSQSFTFTGDPAHDALPWRFIAEGLARQYPQEIPPNPCLPKTVPVWVEEVRIASTSGHAVHDGPTRGQVYETTFPPDRWPDRARNYAKCMDVLHRLASVDERGEGLPVDRGGGRPHETAEKPARDPAARGTVLSKEAKALAALADHPDWTDEQIAKAAGCNRKSLYRMTKFRAAKRVLKAGKDELPSGSKDGETGGVEAWDDDVDED